MKHYYTVVISSEAHIVVGTLVEEALILFDTIGQYARDAEMLYANGVTDMPNGCLRFFADGQYTVHIVDEFPAGSMNSGLYSTHQIK